MKLFTELFMKRYGAWVEDWNAEEDLALETARASRQAAHSGGLFGVRAQAPVPIPRGDRVSVPMGSHGERVVQSVHVGSTDLCVRCGGACKGDHEGWFWTEPADPAHRFEPIGIYPETKKLWETPVYTTPSKPLTAARIQEMLREQYPDVNGLHDDTPAEPEYKPAGRGGFEFL